MAGAGHLLQSWGVRGSWRRGRGSSWGVSPRSASTRSTVAAAGVTGMFHIATGAVVRRVCASAETHQLHPYGSVHLCCQCTYWEEDASRGRARSIGSRRGSCFERERQVSESITNQGNKDEVAFLYFGSPWWCPHPCLLDPPCSQRTGESIF